MKSRLLCLATIIVLLGCTSTNGSLVITSRDGGKTVYSKSFDGADWVVNDHLGISVVIDSAAPKSSDDSFADCAVTVYFWNLSQQSYKIKTVSVSLNAKEVNKVSEVTVGAGPKTRTPVNIGKGRVFIYGTSTIVGVEIEMDGQIIKKEIRAARRTEDEIKRYWGTPGSVPPYPWFSSK